MFEIRDSDWLCDKVASITTNMPTYISFAMIMQRRGTGNSEQGTGNGERGTGNLILRAIGNSSYLFSVCFTSFFPVPLSSL